MWDEEDDIPLALLFNRNMEQQVGQLYTDIKRLQVPIFKGAAHEDAAGWHALFTNRVEGYQIPNDRASSVFKMLLAGNALKWYAALPDATKNNFQLLNNAFTNFFVTGGPLKQTQRLAKFHELSQGSLSVRQYYDALLSKSTGLNLDQNTLKSQFLIGLCSHIKEKIILLQPNTLADALEMAEAVEGWGTAAANFHSIQEVKEPETQVNVHVQATLQAIKADIEELKQTVNPQFSSFQGNNFRPQFSSNQRRFPFNPRQAAPRYRGPRQSTQQYRGSSQGEFRCYFCYGVNHKAIHCMARIQQEGMVRTPLN